VDQRNRLDAMTYEVEKNMKEWVDRLDAGQKDRLNGALEKAKQALRSGASADIRTALEELSQAYSAAGASLYQAAQGQQQSSPPPGGEPPSGEAKSGQEDVVEADYEIVDDSKS
jgi:molecular chaperone DnaK